MTVPLLLLSVHVLAPASAADRCALVDLMSPCWRASATNDPVAQMRTSVVEAHRPEIEAAEQYLAANVPHFMQEFCKSFPDFRCNFTFYIAPSFGNMDGSAVVVNDQYRIIFTLLPGYWIDGAIPIRANLATELTATKGWIRLDVTGGSPTQADRRRQSAGNAPAPSRQFHRPASVHGDANVTAGI